MPFECTKFDDGVVFNADCFEIMPLIPKKSVDLILCDLPYGTTKCAWDVILPFDKLWESYENVSKRNTIKCLFGSEPFSSHLRLSNINEFQYDFIWNKVNSGNFQNCKKTPLKIHEIVSVFYKTLVKFPDDTFSVIIRENMEKLGLKQADLIDLCPSKTGGRTGWLSNKINGIEIPTEEQWRRLCSVFGIQNNYYELYRKSTNLYNQVDIQSCNITQNNKGKEGRLGHFSYTKDTHVQTQTGYTKSILTFKRETGLHPTQKPVPLFEFLIKTYTNEGELVLDNCSGSGTTAISCINTNRKFICIERDSDYYHQSVERIKKHLEDRKTERRQ